MVMADLLLVGARKTKRSWKLVCFYAINIFLKDGCNWTIISCKLSYLVSRLQKLYNLYKRLLRAIIILEGSLRGKNV